MAFADRQSEKTIDPYLEWKVRLFVVGAGLAFIGMYLDLGWLMAVAGLLLAAGFFLRVLTRRHEDRLRREREAAEDDEEGWERPSGEGSS